MRVVMDDAGDIPAELIQKHNIAIVPINIMFGTEEFLSGVTMDRASFYAKVEQVTADNFPKTSQPTPYQMEEAYRKLLAEGEDEIVTVTVGQKLSGTYDSAVAAAQALAGQATVRIFDSQAGSAAQGYMALEAARLVEQGCSGQEIMDHLAQMRDKMVVYFTIDSLEYAVKGGRVSSVRSLMASLLNIKPLLKLNDGLIVEAGRVRTRKRAIDEIVDSVAQQVGDRPARLAYIHANAHDEALVLRDKARQKFDVIEEFVADMTIPVAINLGPGALGLVAMPD